MWNYERHFRHSAQIYAEGIFNRLDKNLEPRVFLIGVLNSITENLFGVCFEPDDIIYSKDIFKTINKDARVYLTHMGDSEKESHYSQAAPPSSIEDFNRKLYEKSIMTALQKTLDTEDEKLDVISFCSYPVIISNYIVCVVIQFNRRVFKSYYSTSVKNDKGQMRSDSLLEATINLFLDRCSKAMRTNNPGSEINLFGREYDEVVRSAGNMLMQGLVGGKVPGIFEICNIISSLKYEGKEGIGKILFAPKSNKSVDVKISLSLPVLIRDFRTVRKLLELASERLWLLCDYTKIYGLGGIEKSEGLFMVNFSTHYSWELQQGKNILMRLSYGQPYLPGLQIDEEKFKSDVKRIFQGISDDDIINLWKLIIVATQQKSGTMVVVSQGAFDEAERLEEQCIKVKPVKITPDIMAQITSIDGAVLLSPQAYCYAIGVILDGLASKKGTPSRGARYNSAVRYIESSQYPCIAVVVSEDGLVDLIPDLLPQIRRSDILKAVSELRSLKYTKTVNFDDYNRIMNWLNDHHFYLMGDVCEDINQLKREILTRLDTNTIRINYPDFVYDPEMNNSYFIEE